SGEDTKWMQLSQLLAEVFTPVGIADPLAGLATEYGSKPADRSPRQKLVLFTEHRDTLTYLATPIRTLPGRDERRVRIHGGIGREQRRRLQAACRHAPAVKVLIAAGAAGEGRNVARAHLMVSCDLPWDPNRLGQRFGRIHRIGQP